MAEILFTGGINQQGDFNIQDGECSAGQNFKLDQNTREFRPREPQDLVATATNQDEITGIMQLIERDGTQSQLVIAGVQVYEWDLGSTFTSRGNVTTDSRLREAYWSLDDILIITDLDLNNVVKTWDGTTFGTLTHGIGGVTNLKAKYAVEYAHRMWLFNVDTDGTALPHVCLASEFEDDNNFDSTVQSKGQDGTTAPTVTDAFFMTTPNLREINGVAKFFNTIVISTVGGELFKLEGFDATDFKWTSFYPRSAAVGTEAIQTIGNDVVFMKDGGAIDLLSSTEQFGDVAVDDLSRFILDEVSGLTDAQIVYDQTNQQVLFFVTDKVLVLDKSRIRSGVSPWAKYVTGMANSFNTKAAKYLKLADGSYKVYWGDDVGRILDFRGTGTSGDRGAISVNTTRTIKRIEGSQLINGNAHGLVEYKRVGQNVLNITLNWHRNYGETSASVPLLGPITAGNPPFFGGSFYFGGDHYFNEGVVSTEQISYKGFTPAGRGPGVTVILDVLSTNDFLINRIIL